MKVIDLLNKIANGEETFFETKLNDKSVVVKYYNDRNFSSSTDPELLTIADIIKSLNNKVEILGEEKKIPEKLDHLIGYDIQQFDDLKEYVEITTNDLFGKVNKVIDTLNQVIDYLKSKGE